MRVRGLQFSDFVTIHFSRRSFATDSKNKQRKNVQYEYISSGNKLEKNERVRIGFTHVRVLGTVVW